VTHGYGGDDPFHDVSTWDEGTAREWLQLLDQRAAAPDQVRIRRELLRVANLQSGDRVAELGCGTGALLLDLARAVGPDGRVFGFDPEPHLVQAARARVLRGHAGPQVAVEVGSADDIRLPSGSVDACAAQTVMLHLGDEALALALAEVRRVLRPGGRFVSVDQDGDTWTIDHPDRDLTRRIVQFHCDQRYADGWTGRRLSRLLREAGFEDVQVHVAVHVDAEPGSYLHGMALRIVEAAAENGAITPGEAEAWTRQLEDLTSGGHFLSSINHYITAGRAP
jgi:ubiquinone/menaquinone biosynthesis C-methylase UbiE